MRLPAVSFVILPVLALVSGCATSATEATSEGAEADLKSAQCPATLAVDLGAPSIPSDASLTAAYTRDFAGQPDAAKEAAGQLEEMQPFLAEAHSTTAISLTGKLAQACHYTTVDASTGKPTAFSIWLAQSNGAYSLRITKAITGLDELFYSLPLKSVTTSGVEATAGVDARVYGENTDRGHDGSDGYSAWIGYASATVK